MKPINVRMFGDSYIQDANEWVSRLKNRLAETWSCSVTAFGKGGSNQYYAIDKWHRHIEFLGAENIDYAVFTFTWPMRQYHSNPYINDQMCLHAEHRPIPYDDVIQNAEDAKKSFAAYEQFWKYLYDKPWRFFDYELELQYILNLPEKYPNIKFIFIPNCEHAQVVAKKHFKQGILLDFAFETVSLNEPITDQWEQALKIFNERSPNRPNTSPTNPLPGHLNSLNHRVFCELMYDIIVNYDNISATGGLYSIDYDRFNHK
jgi:hypothetical protein